MFGITSANENGPYKLCEPITEDVTNTKLNVTEQRFKKNALF